MEEQIKWEERQLRSDVIYEGRVVRLLVDQVSLPNGGTSVREYVRHVGAVAVLPLTANEEVICVRQYRYAHGRVLTEIPAGKLDFAGEDRREAALRELREETGIRPGRLTALGPFLSTPAILDEVVELFLAEDLTFGENDPDEDELLEVVRIPLSRLVDEIMAGESSMDGKTQLAVLKTQELLRRRALLEKENQ